MFQGHTTELLGNADKSWVGPIINFSHPAAKERVRQYLFEELLLITRQ